MEALTSALTAPAAADDAVWSLDLTALVGKEYVPFVQDVVRMVCVQLTIQLLYHLGSGTPFFSSDFVMLLMYVVLGVMLYWLVLRKLVALR